MKNPEPTSPALRRAQKRHAYENLVDKWSAILAIDAMRYSVLEKQIMECTSRDTTEIWGPTDAHQEQTLYRLANLQADIARLAQHLESEW